MSAGLKLAIGGVVLASATAYVALLGASSSWQYYLTADECAARLDQFAGKRMRVSGRVAVGSLQIPKDRSQAAFTLVGHSGPESGPGQITASCPGPLPDNLAEDIDVVVEGRLDEAGHLHGEKVMTKCASKYESK